MFIRIVDEKTFFKDIYQVRPGHYFIIKNGEMIVKRYWNLKPKEPDKYSLDKVVQNWRNIFYESIKIHLRTDVPLGFAISGGIDSSGLIAVALDLIRRGRVRERGIDPVKIYSFSSVIDDPKIGEGKYVELLTKYFGIELVAVKPDIEDIKRELSKFIYYQEEPPEGPSVFAHWCLTREVSKYVKVLLDGQGGDELLAGYHAYIPTYLKGLLRRGRIIKFLAEAWRLRDLIMDKFRLGLKVYLGRRRRLVEEILGEEIRKYIPMIKRNEPVPKSLKEALLIDLRGGRLHEILRFEDRNSMAYSIEIRVPYVNHILAEFIMRAPEEACINSGWTKYIHREILNGLLPDEIRLRRTKIGFEVPEASWLRYLHPWIEKKFQKSNLAELGIINKDKFIEKLRQLINDKLSEEYARALWRILFLEEWVRIYISQ